MLGLSVAFNTNHCLKMDDFSLQTLEFKNYVDKLGLSEVANPNLNIIHINDK